MQTFGGIVLALVVLLAWQVVHRGPSQYNAVIYPFDDADEWRYTACSRLVEHGYALFTQVFSAQPPVLFLTLAASMHVAGDSIAGARVVEIAFGVLGLLAAVWVAWQVAGEVAAVVAALLLAVSPAFLVYSRAVEAEGPMMALTTVALGLAIAAGRRKSAALSVVSGLALAAAVLTKLFAVEALAPAVWALLVPLDAVLTGRPLLQLRAHLDRSSLLRLATFLLAAIVPVALEFLLVAPAQQWEQVIALHNRIAAVGLPGTISPVSILFHFLILDLGLSLLAAAGVLGCVLLGEFVTATFLLLWLGGTGVMLLVFHPLFPHHPAILLTGLAVAGGIAVAQLARRVWFRDWSESRVVPVVLSGLALVAYLALIPRLAHDDRHVLIPYYRGNTVALVPYTIAHSGPSQFVAVDDLAVADLANRLVAPPLCDPSNVRLHAGDLTAQELIDATRRYHVALVLPSFGIFAQVPAYLNWLRGHYRPVPAPHALTAYVRR